jgi:membrane protein YqaA with SNARE-associated domain
VKSEVGKRRRSSESGRGPVLDTWRLVLRSLAVLLVFLAVSLVLIRLELPVEDQARTAVARAGLAGVFVFVFVVDTFVVPATMDIVFPFTHSWSPLPLLTVMSIASVLGGICGYWIGRSLYFLPFVRRTVAGYYRRGAALVERYGYWGVVLAAMTPLPFSTISWIAGMLRIPFGRFAAAALWRTPRVVGYWALLQAGIALTG